MKQELQEQLFKKYPNIFRQKDLSPEETCMCHGIECGDGWYDIIDTLCSNIQCYVDQGEPSVEAKQVKSKWGGLRFYTDTSDEYVRGLIVMAQRISYKIDEAAELPFTLNELEAENDWEVSSVGESLTQ